MIGFLTGVAINIVFGQIPDLVGARRVGTVRPGQVLDLVTHPSQIELATTAAAWRRWSLLLGLARTRLAAYCALIALIIPSVVVAARGLHHRRAGRGLGRDPAGLPLPPLPDSPTFSVSLVTGALSVAAIVLIQGAGVAESAPNPTAPDPTPNRDFMAQGVGNLLSGLFRGQPVGGSVGQTALSVSAGARSRWAAISPASGWRSSWPCPGWSARS